MNDIRRTILWVIFGFSLVMLWDQWQVYNGRPAMFFPSATPHVAAAPAASTPASAPLPMATQPGATASVAGAPLQGAPAVATTGGEPAHERFTVHSDVLSLTFDTRGGTLVHSEFLKHHEQAHPDQHVVLFDESPERTYVAQTGLIGAVGAVLPTHQTVMRLTSPDRDFRPGSDELTLRFESPDLGGVQLIKTYTLHRNSYVVDVKHEVRNTGTATVTPQLYLEIVRDGSKVDGPRAAYSTFTGPAIYTDTKKYQKVDFTKIEKGTAEFEKTSTNGYVAMVQHYFASAWLLGDGLQRENFARKIGNNLYDVGMITPLEGIAPGASRSVEARLFVGPQEEKLLESLAPGLELVKDYGWLTILAKPLYWLLEKIHGVIQNWGWSIVMLVVLLKIIFFWLNAKAYASMAKMKAITPKITEIRTRYKDKPQQMQQEMMRIYREEKVNPMGGCLPIVVQMPVFIALYWVLLSTVEMRNAPWILWIHDLSANDPYFILPLLMTATTMLQTALNPAPPDPTQAKMMWIMPLVFSVMFFFFPAGLVLYWLTNNILSIAQQWIINRRLGVPPQFNLPKFR